MLTLNGDTLTIKDIARVAKSAGKVQISAGAMEKIEKAHEAVKGCLRDGRPVYGINTGFGSLCNTLIEPELLHELQHNLVRSHAAGTGELFSNEVVRGAMVLRANNFCRGYSGVRPIVVETLVSMINCGIVPAVRSGGSLGASGDLAPLADLALVLTGEGQAWFEGKLLDGGKAMELAGIAPLQLEAKEGLALLNGTAFMTSMAVLACEQAMLCLEALNGAAALSLLGFDGTSVAYTEGIVDARPHHGAHLISRHMNALVNGSLSTPGNPKTRVQDPYSFRCVPQVHGTALTALLHALDVIGVEANSATDNPLVVDGEVLSGGNFHGQPVGAVMDYLTLAMTSLAVMSERRVNQLVDDKLSGLPAFLVPNPGLNSGLMISQYTAASLVNECRVLATPASIQSIPVSAEQEDHISMATFAANKAMQVMAKITKITAIELLTAAQAVDLRLGGKATQDSMGPALYPLYAEIRQRVPFVSVDQRLSGHIDELAEFVGSGGLHKVLKHEGFALMSTE